MMKSWIGCILLVISTTLIADENSSENTLGYELGKAIGEAAAEKFSTAITDAIEQCKSLPGNAERTSCLIKIQRSLGTEPTVDVHGQWVVGIFSDEMTDQINGAATVQAEPRKDSAKLSVRCLRGKVALFNMWPSSTKMPPPGRSVKVRTRIDSEQPTVTTWRMAEISPNVAFYQGDSIVLANKLIQSEKFVIELASTQGTGVNLFDTRKAEMAFAKLRASCNW